MSNKPLSLYPVSFWKILLPSRKTYCILTADLIGRQKVFLLRDKLLKSGQVPFGLPAMEGQMATGKWKHYIYWRVLKNCGLRTKCHWGLSVHEWRWHGNRLDKRIHDSIHKQDIQSPQSPCTVILSAVTNLNRSNHCGKLYLRNVFFCSNTA